MKKQIVYTLMFIVLASCVYSIDTDHPNLIDFVDFEEASGNFTNYMRDDFKLVPVNASGNHTTTDITYRQTALSPSGSYSVALDDTTGIHANGTGEVFVPEDLSGDFVAGCWFKWREAITVERRLVGNYYGTDGKFGWYINHNTDGFLMRNAGEESNINPGNPPISYDANWEGILGIWYNSSANWLCALINDTLYNCQVHANGMTNGDYGFAIKDNSDNNPILPFDATIDDCFAFNLSINNATLTDIYTNGITNLEGGGPGAPVVPTFAFPNPANAINNNTNVTFNVTHPASADIRYWLNISKDGGIDLIYANNQTETASGHFSFFTNVSDGAFDYKFYVQNISNGAFSNTISRTWTLDTNSPTITIQSNNFFKIDNLTKINPYLTANVRLNISLFDTNLAGGQTLLNITNTTSQSIFQILNTSITGTTVNITNLISVASYTLGDYKAIVAAADSHTLNFIKDYVVDVGDKYLQYTTEEDIIIRVESLETKDSINTLSTTKTPDRYKFNFNFKDSKATTQFRLTSNKKLHYLENSDYKAHFVTFNGLGGNWIDFNLDVLSKKDYTIEKVNDYVYTITLNNANIKEFSFNSIGGLNLNEKHYGFEVTSVLNFTAYDPILNKTLNFTSILGGISKNSTPITNTTQYANISGGTHLVTIIVPEYSNRIISINAVSTFHAFTINMSQTNQIDDCSAFSNKIITFYGRDEEDNLNVTMNLDITIEHFTLTNLTDIKNSSFSFNGSARYDICTSIDETFIIDAIMDYGDGSNYAIRKYYINNLSINVTQIESVYLYHLNNSKASEITLTVFDSNTGDRVVEAYIKILRFYPGENVFRIVEIAKTDGNGQSLGKMVLADVFYKFIIEKPAGVAKLDTGTLRILSLSRSFGISFIEDFMDTWNRINEVYTSVTCTKSTKTCRITWNDATNVVQDVTLEVWRMNGLANKLLSSQTTSAASGTISYTVTESTDGNNYVAKGFIESNTGRSTYPTSWASFFYSDNPFFTDSNQRVASLFPLLLLVIVIVFALIDFGVIGVVIGALLGLILGAILKILPLSPFYFVSFIIMAIILSYKLSK